MSKSKIQMMNKDEDLSTILDYSLDIEHHLKMIKLYTSEEEELEELISEDVDEIKFLINEIFQLALKVRRTNEENCK